MVMYYISHLKMQALISFHVYNESLPYSINKVDVISPPTPTSDSPENRLGIHTLPSSSLQVAIFCNNLLIVHFLEALSNFCFLKFSWIKNHLKNSIFFRCSMISTNFLAQKISRRKYIFSNFWHQEMSLKRVICLNIFCNF